MKPTKSMLSAIAKVRPSERRSARLLAERVYFHALNSIHMQDAQNQHEAREWAGEAAAAEVIYRFTRRRI